MTNKFQLEYRSFFVSLYNHNNYYKNYWLKFTKLEILLVNINVIAVHCAKLTFANREHIFCICHTTHKGIVIFFAQVLSWKLFLLVFEPRSKTNAIKFGATKRNVTDYKGVQLG